MDSFQHYLDPKIPLETRLRDAFERLRIESNVRDKAMAFLGPLLVKDGATYEHSIRVALLSEAIARFMHLESKAGLFAGLLHDVGKAQTKLSTLQKTSGWTEDDSKEMLSHVMDGYRLIRGCFDFSAEIILWHHRFQARAYPETLPDPLHEYCQGTRILIPVFGRVLSIADTYDASHRLNDKHGATPPSGEEIKEKMLLYNRDQAVLVRDLYKVGIFTTDIVAVN